MNKFLSVECQLRSKKMVSPVTHKPFLQSSLAEMTIETEDKMERYRVLPGGIPVLVADEESAAVYSSSSDRMNREYTATRKNWLRSAVTKLKQKLGADFQTVASRQAMDRIFDGLPADALCVSIGGGPLRAHERLVNLNIGNVPNVDVVADAHRLPYQNESVDAVHCVAVIEHLSDPKQAAQEIFRVLKKGGRAYIDTPFMQAYHGYPNHFQNYTLSGHILLFQKAGLHMEEVGCSVGPVCAIVTLVSTFFREYIPKPLNKVVQACWWAMSVPIRPLDKLIAARKNAFVLASSTYILVDKPGS